VPGIYLALAVVAFAGLDVDPDVCDGLVGLVADAALREVEGRGSGWRRGKRECGENGEREAGCETNEAVHGSLLPKAFSVRLLDGDLEVLRRALAGIELAAAGTATNAPLGGWAASGPDDH
jgi:hypothetical protein